MEFTRGDPAYHTLSIPTSAWTSGGRLFFAAKQLIDDDNTDAASLISADWGDASVTDVVINNIAYKQYACTFPGSATDKLISAGAESADYLGEFEFVNSNGAPMTFPASGPRIPVKVWFDVKRKTTV